MHAMIRDTTAVSATAPIAHPAAPRPQQESTDLPAKPPAVPVPNPKLRLDPALHLVVIEFRDAEGEVEATIPSPRELDAYRSSEREAEAQPHLDVAR
jgi:hypothetical protein